VVTSGQHHQQQNPAVLHPQRDANNPAGLLAIAEETLAEFMSKATGTAVEWVQMVGMKPGPDSIGIIAVSHNCSGVAARACGLVSLEPTKVAEILKDRPSWYRDCRCVDIIHVIPTGNGGTIELIYMQVNIPNRDSCVAFFSSITSYSLFLVITIALFNSLDICTDNFGGTTRLLDSPLHKWT
jgi:homeobox-leucine zipper protein